MFYILPVSRLEPYNPRVLPREVYAEDVNDAIQSDGRTLPVESELDAPVPGPSSTQEDATTGPKVPKKKGRPSKRDMAKKAKDAVAGLDRWLQRTDSVGRTAGGDRPSRARGHGILPHGPAVSRASYRTQKMRVLDALLESEGGEGVEALERANMAVVGRLKRIDAMAAEKGMEVGGEGGELTGLGRVERAARELGRWGDGNGNGGVLSLSEGAGLSG